ncbi:MAG: hypothetical protein WAM53_01240 [Terrimicrobiaceae bacterium]|jgi:uncharacterized membrane protein
MITVPVWVPIYFAYVGCRRLAEARTDRKAKPETAELKPVWVPTTDMERAVYAALLVAGKPITNDELARLLRLSKGETSRRVAQLDGRVQKTRIGRRVQISIPHLPN